MIIAGACATHSLLDNVLTMSMNLPKAKCSNMLSNLRLISPICSLVETKTQHILPCWNHKVSTLSLSKAPKQNTLCIQNFARPPKGKVGCSCLGSLVESEFGAASGWIGSIDQTLLIVSMFLAYMAGVFPAGKPLDDSRKKSLDDMFPSDIPTMHDCNRETDNQASSVWNIVKNKLTDSLSVIEHSANLENKGSAIEQNYSKRPLSLYAISAGPRFRLLTSSLEQLEKQVSELPDSFQTFTNNGVPSALSSILQKTCQSACLSWIREEFTLENYKPDTALPSLLFEKLKGDNVISQNIVRLGKMDLYVDLLYFLRYGVCREGYLYDHNLYMLHGASILEDLLVTLADGIASLYLELISVDGDISDRVNDMGLRLCNQSTRALQKIRNEVTMNQWLYQNFEAVASMYEDRFDLCTLQRVHSQESMKSYNENPSWWKGFSLKRSSASQASSQYAAICDFSLSVKRTKELRALAGWKYYFSLFLELSDILEPLSKAVISQVSNAISFLLVTLIGRSLGLVYTGIRQSLKWKT